MQRKMTFRIMNEGNINSERNRTVFKNLFRRKKIQYYSGKDNKKNSLPKSN